MNIYGKLWPIFTLPAVDSSSAWRNYQADELNANISRGQTKVDCSILKIKIISNLLQLFIQSLIYKHLHHFQFTITQIFQ